MRCPMHKMLTTQQVGTIIQNLRGGDQRRGRTRACPGVVAVAFGQKEERI